MPLNNERNQPHMSLSINTRRWGQVTFKWDSFIFKWNHDKCFKGNQACVAILNIINIKEH